MEKSFNLKVSVRMNQRCRQVVDQVSFNHLILFCGKEESEHRKFQVDKIYSPTDNNQKLFEHILRIPSNLMLEGFSSVVFCLGSPGSGKTYSLAGKTYQNQQKQIEPGIMIYMMRRLFSKFKHELSLYSTYSFWCRFLFVEKGKVRDLDGQLQDYQWQQKEKTKIQIKNYSHFEELIAQIYSNNNNKCHTIIELILQKETPNQQATTSSITFVQFGSFFYNCPYREAEKFSMENDIEATFLTIKTLERSKQAGISNIFETSLLTKILRKTLMKACSFQFLGLLDQSSQNNLKTLNFLDIIMHKKKNYVYSKNAKQQIKRQEVFLKGLYEKHRRVLNLLSRCIGMELGYLDKEKKRNFDGPVLNTFYKTCEKIKYANLKKVQNEKQLEQIKKQIDIQKAELIQIDAEYDQKFRKLQNQKLQILSQKQQLVNLYESTVNPSIKFSQTDNSLYCKLQDSEATSYKKFNLEQEQRVIAIPHPMETQRQSRNEAKSFKIVYSTHQISNRKNAQNQSQKSITKIRINNKYERNQLSEINELANRRLKQIKTEIGKIFKMVLQQNLQLQKLQKKVPLHHQDILNKLKNRNKEINFNIEEAQNCYLNLPENSNSPYQYKEMLQNLKIHSKVQKDLASNNPNSMGVISLKSLRSDKQFKVA